MPALLNGCPTMTVRPWPMADGRWPMANGQWPMADRRWPIDDGRSTMADRRWTIDDRRSTMDDLEVSIQKTREYKSVQVLERRQTCRVMATRQNHDLVRDTTLLEFLNQ